jgi:hypothetical protein
MKFLLKTVLLISVISTISNAKPEGKEPPKEAIEICVGQEVGSTCTMNTPRGEMTGQCMNTPDKKYFVCMPENGPDKK